MQLQKREVLDFLSSLQTAYFEDRDLQKVLQNLTPDIHWIGIGQHEICHNFEEAAGFLTAEAARLQNHFTVLDSAYDIMILAEDLALAQGSVLVHENDTQRDLAAIVLRATLILKRTAAGLRLQHMHLSVPSPDQSPDEFFPKVLTKKSSLPLRRLYDEQSAVLAQKSKNLDAISNNLPGGILSCDTTPELNILQYSDGFLKLFGYTAQDLQDRFQNKFYNMIYEKDRQAAWDTAWKQLSNGPTKELEYRVPCKDGSLIWVLDRGQLLTNDDGQQTFSCILIDITETKKAQEALRLSLERHQIIMDQTSDIIFEWDIALDSLQLTPNFKKKFGYDSCSRLHSRPISAFHFHPDDLPVFVQTMDQVFNGALPYAELELRIAKADGQYLWCRIRATIQQDKSGTPIKAVGLIMDIDAEKRATQSLRERAERDPLTGLYNKGAAQYQIEYCLRNASKEDSSAFFIIDVDNFKHVNDIFGHLSGDAMLMDVASGLRKLFRSNDILGRIGGDEFVVFMRNTKKAGVEKKAKCILDLFNLLLEQSGETYHLSCSVGISMYPDDGSDFISLFQKADTALYQAKAKGKDTYAFYVPNLPPISITEQRNHDAAEHENVTFKSSLAEYIFHLLYQADDIDQAIPLILELTGKQMDVSRVYIFEDSEDGLTCSNTYEWCSDGVAPQIAYLQNIRYADLGDYYGNFDQSGIFYCRDIQQLNEEKSLLSEQGIKSMLQCAIRDNGQMKGFVGFDECRTNRFWTQAQVDALSFIAEILGVFLLKQRAQARKS